MAIHRQIQIQIQQHSLTHPMDDADFTKASAALEGAQRIFVFSGGAGTSRSNRHGHAHTHEPLHVCDDVEASAHLGVAKRPSTLMDWLRWAFYATPLAWHLWPKAAWTKYCEGFYGQVEPELKAYPERASPTSDFDQVHAQHLRSLRRDRVELAKLERKFRVRMKRKLGWGFRKSCFTIATVRVDGQHQAAGSTNVIELHGTLQRHRCIRQGHPVQELDFYGLGGSQLPLPPTPPRCHHPHCESYARPDCVLFSEPVPPEAHVMAQLAVSELREGDVCLVVGSGTGVFPACYLPEMASKHATVIICHKDVTDLQSRCAKGREPICLLGDPGTTIASLAAAYPQDAHETPLVDHEQVPQQESLEETQRPVASS